MMNGDDTNLEALGILFTEFYSPTLNNERRKEIQTIFTHFEQSSNALDCVLYYLWRTVNQYVANYCFGFIETFVTQKWFITSEDNRVKIYIFIKTYMIERVENEATFLIKKAANILASIACYDWPTKYQEYIDFIKSQLEGNLLNSNPKKSLISLFSIKAIFVRFSNPMSSIDNMHKMELHKSLCNQSGQFCEILTIFISDLCQADLFDLVYSYLEGNLNQANSSEFWHPILLFIEALVSDSLNNSNRKSYLIFSYFDCLCEIFNFMSLENVYFRKLLGVIFLFSLVGSPQCLSACVGAEETLALSTTKCGDLKTICLSSLSCVYELVDKRGLTNLYQITILSRLIQCHLDLITNNVVIEKYYASILNGTHLSKECTNNISFTLAIDANKQVSCHDYKLKLVYLIRSLIPNIIKSLYLNKNNTEMKDIFDFESFVQLFCKFTFSILNLEIYFAALNAWSNFFECIQFYRSSEPQFMQIFLTTNVLSTILNFGKALLSRLFYSDSSSFLTALDDEDMFDDEFSEKESSKTLPFSLLIDDLKNYKSPKEPCEYLVFFRESLIVFQNLIDLLPKELLSFVFDRFAQNRSDYFELIHSAGMLIGGQFSIPKGLPAHRIHWILRDYASSMQIVGFLFEHIHHLQIPSIGLETLDILVHCLHIGVSIYPVLDQIHEQLIRQSFIEVIVQNLLTLRAILIAGCLGCISKSQASLPDKIYLTYEERDKFVIRLITLIGQFMIPLPSSSSTRVNYSRITKYAAQLFKSLFTSPIHDLRPPSSLVLKCNDDPTNTTTTTTTITTTSDDITESATVFQRLFDMICEPVHFNNYSSDYCIINSLISTFIFYLSWDEQLSSRQSKESNSKQLANTRQNALLLTTKQNLLNRLVVNLFVPTLNLIHLQTDPNSHLIYLGFLNEAIHLLDESGNSARNLIHSILTNSGLMDQLINCLIYVLNRPTNGEQTDANPNLRIQFCTAYFAFLVTFVQILTNSSATLSSVPQILVQIIQTLRHSTLNDHCNPERTFPHILLEYLMPMFLFISRHKKIFPSILMDTLDLYVCTFLPALANECLDSLDINRVKQKEDIGVGDGDGDGDDLNRILNLVSLAGIHNGQLMQQFYELIFSILINHFSLFFVDQTVPSNGASGFNDVQPKSHVFVPVKKSYQLQYCEAFHQLIRIILAVFHANQVNSSLIQYVIENLINLNRLRRFFNLPDFNQTWLSELIRLCLDILIGDKHEACHHSLIELVFHCVLSLTLPMSNESGATVFNLFVQVYLPEYLRNVHRIRTDQDQRSILSCFVNQNQHPVSDKLLDFETFNEQLCGFVQATRSYRFVVVNHG